MLNFTSAPKTDSAGDLRPPILRTACTTRCICSIHISGHRHNMRRGGLPKQGKAGRGMFKPNQPSHAARSANGYTNAPMIMRRAQGVSTPRAIPPKHRRLIGGKSAFQLSRVRHISDCRLCTLSRPPFPRSELVVARLQLHVLRMVGLAISVLNDLLNFDRLLYLTCPGSRAITAKRDHRACHLSGWRRCRPARLKHV